jgi:hypothetical protein
VAHCIDALMHSMQPAPLQPVPDRTSPDPDVGELPSRDDPVLPRRERGNLGVDGVRRTFGPYDGLNRQVTGHRHSVARGV